MIQPLHPLLVVRRLCGPHISASVTVIALAALLNTLPSIAQEHASSCGSLENAYGPYDYRTDKAKLPIVLSAHFPPHVEALIRGNTSARPGGDIDYTLRAIPNHPQALLSMMRLGQRENTDKPSRYTVECYFERAIRFRPDDQVVRMLYATFLTNKNRKSEAAQQLEIVVSLANDNPFTHYNVGLLYFDLGEHDRALAQAHKVIRLGFTRPELRDKLQSAGRWEEPSNTSAGGAVEQPAAASGTQRP